MNFSIKIGDLEKIKAESAIFFIQEKYTNQNFFKSRQSNKFLKTVFKGEDFSGKLNSSVTLYNLPESNFKRVLFFGVGDINKLSIADLEEITKKFLKFFFKTSTNNLIVSIDSLSKKFTEAVLIKTLSSSIIENTYNYSSTKSTKEKKFNIPSKITFYTENKKQTHLDKFLFYGKSIGEGINLTKELGNLPPNICTPEFLAKQSLKVGKSKLIKTKVLGLKQIQKYKMGSFLSVAKGSRLEPKLSTMEYYGSSSSKKPIVLIGKGITFDTGGISLKPSSSMDEMKYDMSGAGTVIGVMHAIKMMKLPINVIGIVVTTENMPGGNATRPGDVVKSMSGKTIEILNTDAEGRLILCDAITYSKRFNPEVIIDIATLTGACLISLGKVASGLFSNNQELANDITKAGEDSYDRVWQMPIWSDYRKQLDSNFADLANIGGRYAGSITAACFLSEFAEETPWAHLDIAGTAWESGASKGATGRPVKLLTQYLINKVNQ